MAIVAHGLGQPEDGALVALGFGIAGAEPNALRANLGGSSTVTARLEDGAAPAAVAAGSPHFRGWVIPVLPTAEKPTVAPLAASLTGSSTLTARIDFTIDPDQLAYELTVALLLDLV